jgi:phosphatidylglycerol:prolipoprotein diacylglycerol transferase
VDRSETLIVAKRYVHDIDPIVADIAGVHLWWYGLGFALGFLSIHRFLIRDRARLGASERDVWSLSILMIVGVLIGGRAVEIAFDEWPFYRAHPGLIPAFWLGGMATHGLLIGAAAAAGFFAVLWKIPFRTLADTLVVPGAFLMGVGRIGNFIDGQIVGSVTDLWWGVKFPYADGFRHPIVLYDGAKNLLLIPYLLHVRRTNPTPRAVAARFAFWYAFPRIFIDLFRDYPTHRLAIGTGQTLNLIMTAIGVVLLVRSRLRRLGRLEGAAPERAALLTPPDAPPRWIQRVGFACLLAFCLTIPSNWTQNVPVRYAGRHAGLAHSWLYPNIDWAPPPATSPASLPRATGR